MKIQNISLVKNNHNNMIRMNEEAKDGQRMEEARMVKDGKDLKGLQTNIKKIGLKVSSFALNVNHFFNPHQLPKVIDV